jgi:predicted esterase
MYRPPATARGRAAAAVLAAIALACPGCEPGGSSDPAPPAAPPSNPQCVACLSVTPVDSGDPNKPVITLLGPSVVRLPLGTPYTDPGAAAADPHDGDISSRIAVSGLDVLGTGRVGDYLVRYNVANSAGLAAVEVARIVRVYDGARFATQTAREQGATGAHMAYYEHLPVNYGEDPVRTFPLIVFQHGWGAARFNDDTTVKNPITVLLGGDLAGVIQDGAWDDARPFIVLTPQRCLEPADAYSPLRTKIFIDYAVNTYKVDTSRIYMAGYSAGSCQTWDYAWHYPNQLAAIVPMSGSYTQGDCRLKDTPAWAFQAADDPVGSFQLQVQTVNIINACNPPERARITIFPSGGHNVVEEYLTLKLTGLGLGLPAYDVYDRNIYDWLLDHRRDSSAAAKSPLVFQVRPEVIALDRPATLTWSADGAGPCLASGDWFGPRPASGAEPVTPVAPGQYNYVLTCGGPAGTIARAISLEVKAPTARPEFR